MKDFIKQYKWPLLALFFILFGFGLAQCSRAQSIPAQCYQYKAQMTRTVYQTLSPAAPVSLFASQMLQESSCNSLARSPAGAQGLLQFMPDTALWIHDLDARLAPAQPYNPSWAMQAQATYMLWLMNRDPGRDECDTYAFALSSYNGGEGWLRRDQALTRSRSLDPLIWFGVVEINADPRRSKAAVAENRGYPRRIMFGYQPRFVAAGWGRGVDCS